MSVVDVPSGNENSKQEMNSKEVLRVPDEVPLDQSIPMCRLLAAFPRWILRARCSFAWFLARTFSLHCWGLSPASVVYPLPLMDFGLFSGSGPKLSRRRWTSLARKRVLHVIIVALNFLHNDFKPFDLSLLGRRPNSLQRRFHSRLLALLTTCDAPADVPIPAGRSGPEFVARLLELERFVKAQPAGTFDSYEDGFGDCSIHGGARGWIKEEKGEASCTPSPSAPYHSLDASRLKLTGQGNWPLGDFLHDELWLPYFEPRILHHGFSLEGAEIPDFSAEDPGENLRLAKLWSTKGLLALFDVEPPGSYFSRVFNNYKSPTVDRQIGDRRQPNAAERSMAGPSRQLPIGFMMTSLICPRGRKLVGCVTDRKDFYHQAKISRQKAHLNCLPFSFKLSEFQGTEALKELMEIKSRRSKKGTREMEGDLYGVDRTALGVPLEEDAFPAFASLFQGDHLGVEFALSAHSALLADYNLLSESSQLQSKRPFPRGPLWEGLVIDDYFSISQERVGSDGDTLAFRCFKRAAQAYADHQVLGSSEKDVVNSDHFRVVGAEVDTGQRALSNGVALVGAPTDRRLSLAALSLRVARLPCISRALASRLSGAWTFVLMYRRCLTCILGEIFKLGVIGGQPDREVIDLPRSAVNEIVIASSLSFLAVSNVAAVYDKKVYATDASLSKGAVVSCVARPEVAEALWLGGDKRGCYTKLDDGFRAMLKTHGFGTEDVDEIVPEEMPLPKRGLDFSFDFVEICGGASSVSKCAVALGLSVCPSIELSSSPCYDVKEIRLVQWVIYMLKVGRFGAIMLEPPCTTFSPAAHPAVRSYSQPRGFNERCPKTHNGNCLAFNCLAIALAAGRYNRPCLLEQPFLSKMAWLSMWRFLLREKNFSEAVCASCAFGSPHLKQFRLLTYGLDAAGMTVRCRGGHKHLRIEGKWTKPSAVYVPALAEHFALHFKRALVRLREEFEDEPVVTGLESVIADDILIAGKWSLEHQWHWKSQAHINVLESHAYLSLLRKLASNDESSLRFVALLDSRVAKGAHAKGRSTSQALLPTLRKAAAISVGGGLYSALGFAPTRLNTADDPTRDVPIRPPATHLLSDHLLPSQIQAIHSTQLSRSAANWLRLWILVTLILGSKAHPIYVDFGSGSYSHWLFACCGQRTLSSLLALSVPQVVYLGLLLGLMLGLSLSWIALSYLPLGGCRIVDTPKVIKVRQPIHRSHCPSFVIACFLLFPVMSCAMPIASANVGDERRASRRSGVELVADRAVRAHTRTRRETLLDDFDRWLQQWGWSLQTAVDARDADSEFLARLLVQYGRELYYAGKPYGRFSETINGISARRPAFRRQLTQAWDLAFAWVADEPSVHHAPIPKAVLLALCGLALLWGWPSEAAIFMMSWSGLLRIGEALAAYRSDLVLPVDSVPGTEFALLRIRQPKTRGTGAKHQAARLDQEDLVQLLDAVYRDYPRDKKLWPFSGSTLRKRLNYLQGALGLVSCVGSQESKYPYELGSFRPGGATYYLQLFEDPEFVRRRGRWLSHKSMEIYLQEVATATFDHHLTEDAKFRIHQLAMHFPRILVQSRWFLRHHIPVGAWPHLWSTPA